MVAPCWLWWAPAEPKAGNQGIHRHMHQQLRVEDEIKMVLVQDLMFYLTPLLVIVPPPSLRNIVSATVPLPLSLTPPHTPGRTHGVHHGLQVHRLLVTSARLVVIAFLVRITVVLCSDEIRQPAAAQPRNSDFGLWVFETHVHAQPLDELLHSHRGSRFGHIARLCEPVGPPTVAQRERGRREEQRGRRKDFSHIGGMDLDAECVWRALSLLRDINITGANHHRPLLALLLLPVGHRLSPPVCH
mmetsp:Transcript_45149/g.127439  ORF Transcript_45149/g.127439 Transcript_45149/m.127439 type:complete len:244 (-) Transcript_45149:1132-1863(-)